MSYACLSITLGIILIFGGTIIGSIRNLLHKKRAKSAATDNAQSEKLG